MAKKKRRRPSVLYLTRDSYEGAMYDVWASKPVHGGHRWDPQRGEQWQIYEFCVREFERTFPKKIHLKLGGGPLKIKIELG